MLAFASNQVLRAEVVWLLLGPAVFYASKPRALRCRDTLLYRRIHVYMSSCVTTDISAGLQTFSGMSREMLLPGIADSDNSYSFCTFKMNTSVTVILSLSLSLSF